MIVPRPPREEKKNNDSSKGYIQKPLFIMTKRVFLSLKNSLNPKLYMNFTIKTKVKQLLFNSYKKYLKPY